MERIQKIVTLWLLTICGFAAHSICDVLPIFWGKNMAVVATDGNVDYGIMELPSDNAGQYVILPMMIVIGIILAWYSIKDVKGDYTINIRIQKPKGRL